MAGLAGLAGLDILSDVERLYAELRKVQSRTSCGTSALQMILKALEPFLKVPAKCKIDDVAIKAASGAHCIRLHGCVGCHKYVFDGCKLMCPLCGHPRYKPTTKKPYEVSKI